jgi:hypothetical protein
MSENGEPQTPREEAEVKAEMAVRDAWLAVTAASKMFSDPISRPFIERQRDDILSMRTKLDLLASAVLEADNG